MLRKMLAGTVFALLALACLPVLAEETECNASVCKDGSWPEMETVMPPIVLDQHVESAVIAEMVTGYTEPDDAVEAHEQSLHMHQVAKLDEVLEQAEEP